MKVALLLMKKAIVLMMTLGFIALITALVLYTLSISQKSFSAVAQIDAQNQMMLTFQDMTQMLKSISKEIKTEGGLDVLLQTDIPPLTEPKTGMTLGLELDSYMRKINLNALLKQLLPAEGNCDLNMTTELLCRPINRFFERFDIRDKQLLIDLMLDTVDKDDLELGSETEIGAEDIDFAQGKIYSYNHLQKIFDQYYRLSSDKNIYRIDREKFEEVFWFGDTNLSRQMLDCGVDVTASQNAFTYMLPEHMQNGQQDYCALFGKNSQAFSDDAELAMIKNIFRIKQFDLNRTKSKYLIKCNLILGTGQVENELVFDYDIIHKRIDRIEESVAK